MQAFVCVPARDEASRLPDLFTALAAQDAAAGPWSLCLLLDGRRDRSLAVVRRLAGRARFPVAVREAAAGPPNAGRARAAALRMAVDSARGAAAIYLTTDADSAPAPDWIACARDALAGCDLATGRITRTSGPAAQDRLEAYYDRLYALRRRLDPVEWDPGPHHHFTGGANMAFRSDAYARLGGFAPLPSGEDARMVDEAQRTGLRVRRDARMQVATSSRRFGRAPRGLASALRSASSADGMRVAHPEAMAWQYASHALARAYFDAPGAAYAAALGQRLSLGIAHLAGVARDCANAESFATRIVPAPPDRRTVSLPEAEAALAALEGAPLERAA